MAIQIVWSDEAQNAYNENINYLQQEWSDKEVANFVADTWRVLKRIEIFPESYPVSATNKKYRKARLNKYIVLFYDYRKTARTIQLITFWNTKQNPSKLNH